MAKNCVECNQSIPESRAALGYNTCINHGTKRMIYPSAPAYNKGPYMLVTLANVKTIGRK